MLLNFRFSNFKSYFDLAHFSMVTGKTRQHPENMIKKKNFNVLTFSALYGANAGGKSNLVEAIRISREIILNGVSRTRIYNRYNKNGVDNQKKASDFEYEILISDRVYVYGFAVVLNEYRIVKEYLLDITDEKREIVVFGREYNQKSVEIEIDYDYLHVDHLTKNKLSVYIDDINDKELLLTTLNRKYRRPLQSTEKESLIFEDVYNWFEDTLEVISPEDPTKSSSFTYLNEENLQRLGEYLRAFDTGIQEVKFERVSEDALGLPAEIREKIMEDIKRDSVKKKTKVSFLRTPRNMFRVTVEDGAPLIQEIRFIHSLSDITYSLEEESDGTKRIIDIFSILFDENQKVYVVDELDRSLHPNLSYKFIEKFIELQSENQLIVTTHEDRLLDLKLLRRDQIWFVEKNAVGDSQLYSLEEYKERFDKDVQKQYLDGRYGSVPNINFDIL